MEPIVRFKQVGSKRSPHYRAYVRDNGTICVWNEVIGTHMGFPPTHIGPFASRSVETLYYAVPGWGSDSYLRSPRIAKYILERLENHPEEFEEYDKKEFRVAMLVE